MAAEPRCLQQEGNRSASRALRWRCWARGLWRMGVPRREANEANEAAEWLATLTTTKCAGPEAARLTYPRLVSGAAGQHFLSRRQPCAARAALPTAPWWWTGSPSVLLHPGGGGGTAALSHKTAALSHKTMRNAFRRGGASAELLSIEALHSAWPSAKGRGCRLRKRRACNAKRRTLRRDCS